MKNKKVLFGLLLLTTTTLGSSCHLRAENNHKNLTIENLNLYKEIQNEEKIINENIKNKNLNFDYKTKSSQLKEKVKVFKEFEDLFKKEIDFNKSANDNLKKDIEKIKKQIPDSQQKDTIEKVNQAMKTTAGKLKTLINQFNKIKDLKKYEKKIKKYEYSSTKYQRMKNLIILRALEKSYKSGEVIVKIFVSVLSLALLGVLTPLVWRNFKIKKIEKYYKNKEWKDYDNVVNFFKKYNNNGYSKVNLKNFNKYLINNSTKEMENLNENNFEDLFTKFKNLNNIKAINKDSISKISYNFFQIYKKLRIKNQFENIWNNKDLLNIIENDIILKIENYEDNLKNFDELSSLNNTNILFNNYPQPLKSVIELQEENLIISYWDFETQAVVEETIQKNKIHWDEKFKMFKMELNNENTIHLDTNESNEFLIDYWKHN